jgi:GDP-L-fucose synthase
MNSNYDTINVVSGTTISISELVDILIQISGFKGKINYDTSKPEGILTRKISNERLQSLGWVPKYTLEDALAETYKWYYDNT